MTLAEIHGKTPFIYSEDLLTADVFTAFRYLPAADGIYAFLRSLLGLGEKLPHFTNEEEIAVNFHFWPIGERQRREPDVLLSLQVDDRLIHVVVEAKYLSGASDLEIQEVEHDGQTYQVGNQLADQFRDLRHGRYRIFQSGQRNHWLTLTSAAEDRYLLYLTAHAMRPDAELRQACTYHPEVEDRLFWTNWYQVYEHFYGLRQQLITFPYSLILEDICLLLERKGFTTFAGFHPLPQGEVKPATASFWQDRYQDEPTFAGITYPPSFPFPVPTSPYIFWQGD